MNGTEGTRTLYLLLARQALSQMSYGPETGALQIEHAILVNEANAFRTLMVADDVTILVLASLTDKIASTVFAAPHTVAVEVVALDRAGIIPHGTTSIDKNKKRQRGSNPYRDLERVISLTD